MACAWQRPRIRDTLISASVSSLLSGLIALKLEKPRKGANIPSPDLPLQPQRNATLLRPSVTPALAGEALRDHEWRDSAETDLSHR